MNRPDTTRMWETFLRIGESATLNHMDGQTAEEKANIDRDTSMTAVHAIKHRVLPLLKKFSSRIEWYSFLIHDRNSGVPVDDDGAYIHLRFSLDENTAIVSMMREEDNYIVDGGPFSDNSIVVSPPWSIPKRMEARLHEVDSWHLLGEQSELVLKVIEQHPSLDDLSLLQQLGQFIHHFTNMTQLPFPRPAWMNT